MYARTRRRRRLRRRPWKAVRRASKSSSELAAVAAAASTCASGGKIGLQPQQSAANGISRSGAVLHGGRDRGRAVAAAGAGRTGSGEPRRTSDARRRSHRRRPDQLALLGLLESRVGSTSGVRQLRFDRLTDGDEVDDVAHARSDTAPIWCSTNSISDGETSGLAEPATPALRRQTSRPAPCSCSTSCRRNSTFP